jgi:hypothetical protein
MTIRSVLAALALAVLAAPALSSPAGSDAETAKKPTVSEIIRVAASYSCSPRKTCKQISSCREAMWLLKNCSWGHRLDRDNDGIPCEGTC